eukprot:2112904-Pyramimonas_sp.AAC.1
MSACPTSWRGEVAPAPASGSASWPRPRSWPSRGGSCRGGGRPSPGGRRISGAARRTPWH